MITSKYPYIRINNSLDFITNKNGFSWRVGSTVPRKYTTPHFIETKGILTITYPEFIRQGRIHGNSIGLYEIKNILSDVEINNSDRLKYFETLINIK